MSERWPGRNRPKTDELAGQYGLAELLKCIGELFTDGKADWLHNQDFSKVIARLQDENYGTIPTPGMTIDVSRLHRNPRLKSGFQGVYANGQGFRAVGRDFAGKVVTIGTFKTAEEAAHRRMLYYRANNLAYGELEAEMELWRSQAMKWGVTPGMTDEQLIAQIRTHHDLAGSLDSIFGPDCVSFEPARSTKLPRRDDAQYRRALAIQFEDEVMPRGTLGTGHAQRALPAAPVVDVAPDGPEPVIFTSKRVAEEEGMHSGPCEDFDGSGACFGCGRWLGDDPEPAKPKPEQPEHPCAIGFSPDDLPESLR